MHNIQRLVSIIMLLVATFSMVASSALPHHHHDDGSICIAIGNNNSNSDAESHSSEGCSDDCAMNVDLLQDASQLGHASKAGFIPTLVAILSWDNTLLPEPQEQSLTTHFIYVKHAYKSIVCSLNGLRAPPYAA